MELSTLTSPVFKLIAILKNTNIDMSNKFNAYLVKTVKIIGGGSIFIAVMSILRKTWYKVYHKYKKYPPGPVGLPFFGCFFRMSNFEEFYESLGADYGPIAMYPFGPKYYQVMVNDIDIAFKLFKQNAFNYRPHSMLTPIAPDLPNAFGGTNGKEWSLRRKLFFNSILKIADSKYMTTHVQNNIKNKIVCPAIELAINRNNGKWKPREALLNYAFNTIFGASFGPELTMKADNPQYLKLVAWSKVFVNYLMAFFLLPLFSDFATEMFKKYVNWEQLNRQSRAIMKEWIAQKKEKKSDSEFKSYVDMMLSSNLDANTITAEIDGTFGAGTGTTAESIELMLLTLAKYPKVEERIYLELRDIFNNAKDIEIESVKQLNRAHVLRAFLEETWRTKAGGGVARELQKDFRVDFVGKNGAKHYYILPKGAAVNFNARYMLTSEEYGWENANEWDINHYLDENGKFVKSLDGRNKEKRFKVTIFGMGGRQCPGVSLARKEVIFAVAILVYKYKFTGPNGDEHFEMPALFRGFPAESIAVSVSRR